MKRPLELICMGRVGVDLYAEQIGAALKDAQSFRKYLGGCAGNIAVGSARLGLSTALFSRVGADAMGDFLREELALNGVCISLLSTDQQHLTALVLLGVCPPDDFPLVFYRTNCADKYLCFADLDLNLLAQAQALLITGTCLAEHALRQVVNQAIAAAKKSHTKLILDIDFRPVLWGITGIGDGALRYRACPEATCALREILPSMDLIVGTEEEFLVAGGAPNLWEALKNIRELCHATLVIKKGAEGCEIWPFELSTPLCFPSYKIAVLNVLGAGDAFMSGFLRGHLRGAPWEQCARYANACGALVVSRHGCSPAMPSMEELELFLHQPQQPNSPALIRCHQRTTLGHEKQEPLLILAFDHRVQFEESCRDNDQPRELITKFKSQVYEGFCLANIAGAAILVDQTYGHEVLQHARCHVGIAAEKAGSFRLEWDSAAGIYQELVSQPSMRFVKVLVHCHSDMKVADLAHQMAKLKELTLACQALERRLMLELLMPPGIPATGENLGAAMAMLYQADIAPWWWKIAGQDSKLEWQRITTVVDEFDPKARLVVLGQGASEPVLKQHLAVARSCHHAVGFAIGRSIFWPAWMDLLSHNIELKEVKHHIAKSFQHYANLWTAPLC